MTGEQTGWKQKKVAIFWIKSLLKDPGEEPGLQASGCFQTPSGSGLFRSACPRGRALPQRRGLNRQHCLIEGTWRVLTLQGPCVGWADAVGGN